MPAIGGLHLIVAVALAIHAMKTGRPVWWLYILLFVPGLGSLAYVFVELIPGMARSRRARRVTSNIGTIIDPNRDWREKVRQAELVDSVDAKRALAGECERKGMWDDAIRLYEAAGTGIFSGDEVLLTGLARASLGKGDPAAALAALDRLREANPSYNNPEAHLLYARALEGAGRTGDALSEYAAVSRTYAGFEARSRYGLLLLKQGQPDEAKRLFEDVVRASKARVAAVSPGDREWIKVARVNLG